ncbi:MAG: hydrogenase maturation protease [Cyclobacteriaceae bacterium]
MKLIEDHNRLVIGVGNAMRGDDAFGVELVEFLKRECPELACYLIVQGDITKLLDHWVDKDLVIIDTVQTTEGRVGEIHKVLDFRELNNNISKKHSTHGLNVVEVFALGQQLDRLPKSTYFLGVEGANWGMGTPISESLRIVMPEIIDEIVRYFDSKSKHNLETL